MLIARLDGIVKQVLKPMPDPIHAERENEKRNIGENVHKNDIETNIAA